VSQERAVDAFEEALREDDPALLYDRAPCGYVSTAPSGRIVKTNETFRTWTGYSAEELAAKTFADLLTVGGRIYHETHYSPMLSLQGAVREIALELVRRDGSRLPVLVNARLDSDDSGAPQVVRIAVFDATERRKYEIELLRAKERAEASEERARALARTLQSSFVPPSVPEVPGLEGAGAYRPAGDGTVVGGDFYDVFPVTSDEWVVVLGDVCGKGPAAAVVTSFVRDSIRVLTVSEPSPARVLAQLNELLLRHGSGNRFCTLVLLRLVRQGPCWRAVVSVGGHPPPVVLRRGEEPAFAPFRGFLVGAFAEAAFTEDELMLHPGDGLVLYTDGITEARVGPSLFGDQAVLESLRSSGRGGSASMADVVGTLVGAALDFQAGDAQDDIAAVGLRVRA
jgi:sigma-B regulation protein RsbU (phosphoserine phosphatase)